MSQKHIDAINRIVDKKCKEYRKTLNQNIHVADISYLSLKASDPALDNNTYSALLDALAENFTKTYGLEYCIHNMRTGTSGGTRYLVEDISLGGYFLVASTYENLQTSVSAVLKKFEHLESVLTGTDEYGKTVTNIGHIASGSLANTTSPLSLKIKDALANLPKKVSEPLKIQLQNLYDVHSADVEYAFHVSDIRQGQRLKKALGTGTILVTLHSFEKNNQLAALEAGIEREVSKYLTSPEVRAALLRQRASNSILEDIGLILASSIRGDEDKYNSIHGKPVLKSKKAQPKSPQPKSGGPRPASLRLSTGRFASLVGIQSLINEKLHDQMRLNMGTGTSRTLLNYRTGRLARSAEVTKITRSREGALSFFCTYMKRPYSTFSAGGAQQYPRSRDPKLLVSKSVRQLAEKLVKNRLRTVSV